jgi:succinyl-diaminopimelate desuccinylase
MNPSPEETALLAHVDAQAEAALGFLRGLVQVPSDNPPGDCAPHARHTKAALEELGFSVEEHAVPAALVAAGGMASIVNLIVRHGFGAGPVVALNAHGDVVPPGEGWSSDPYSGKIRDGWMYGRGVAVSKSDFATYAFALRALIASGVALHGTVELHLTYDEEAGGELGPAWILEQGLSRPDYAICPGFSYDVVTAHNGRAGLANPARASIRPGARVRPARRHRQPACERGDGRASRHHRRAALCRCAPLRRRRHPDRDVRRRSAHAPRSQRAPCR